MAPRARDPKPGDSPEGAEEPTMNRRRQGRMAGKERMMNADGGKKCKGDCTGCKAGKPCKGMKKDGAGCSTKRGDALTPQEYLKACDLGIHGRSRNYIRSRLDAAQEREDRKCGKTGIAPGKKCTKPVMSQAKAERQLATKGKAPSGWTVRRQNWGERFRDSVVYTGADTIKNSALSGAAIGSISGLASGGLPGSAGGVLVGGSAGALVGVAAVPVAGALNATFGHPTSVLERSRGTTNKSRKDAEQAREDRKCGKSGIAPGKKCTKPTQSAVSKPQRGGLLGNRTELALKVGGIAGSVASLGVGVVQASKGNYKGAHRAFAASHGFNMVAGTGLALEGQRTGNKLKQNSAKFVLGVNAALAGANLGASRATTNAEWFKSRPGATGPRTPNPTGPRPPSPNQRVEPVRVRDITPTPAALTPATVPVRYYNNPDTVKSALRNSHILRRTQKPRVGVSTAPRVSGPEIGYNGSFKFGREYAPNPRIRGSRSNELVFAPRKRSRGQATWLDSADND